MITARRFILLVVVSVALLSCKPDSNTPVTLYSEPALDGVVVWEPPGTYTGGVDNYTVKIGDNASDHVMRCVVSFDLATVPAGVEIVSATLRMYQGANQSASGNSYGEAPGLGTVLVDNISYSAFTIGAELWSGYTTGTDIGLDPLASSFSPNTWHELDVTTSAEDEFALYHNGRLQFRIYHHYDTNHDSNEDSDEWVMGDNPTNQPELVIVYR
jgi:hypothetical protein